MRSSIYGELHRFIPVLAHARGFRVSEVEVRHRPRRHGASKYGFSRLFKGFLDLLTVRFLTRFGQRPIHILGGIGLVLFGLGKPGHALSGHTLAQSEEPADRRPPAVAVLDRQPDRRGSSTDPSLGILAELVVPHTTSAPRIPTASPRRFPPRRKARSPLPPPRSTRDPSR